MDRTSSAWLIKRFIDEEADFIFINYPREKPDPCLGIPFDIKGVELGHHGDKCTFETIVEKYNVKDKYVKMIAEVVHEADVSENPSEFALGIKSVFTGLRLVAKDDYEALNIGFKIWDSIYAYFMLQDLMKRYSEEISSLDRIGRIKFLREKVQSALSKL